jgi:hypothetical protein
MKNRQSGLSLIGVLIVGALLAFVFLIGMRCVPVYTEYMAIKRILNVIADSGGSDKTAADVRRDFDNRAIIDDVSTVSGKDLIVDKRRGNIVVSVEYSRTVPIVANVSLLFEFQASSSSSGV